MALPASSPMADFTIDCFSTINLLDQPKVSVSTRCIICRERFEPGDSIFRVRNHVKATDDCMHRRHVDEVLAAGPIDEQRAIDEFVEYREKLLQDLTTG